MARNGTWRVAAMMGVVVWWCGMSGTAGGQPVPPYPQPGMPGGPMPGGGRDAGPGTMGPGARGPVQTGPPPFLIDADTPFERPITTITAEPLFGGRPENATGGPAATAPHVDVNPGPAAIARAEVQYGKMTEMPAGIGYIGGAGIKEKPGRGARAGGSAPGQSGARSGGSGARDPKAPPPAPPPPAGVLDKPGINFLRPLATGASGG